MKFHHFLLHVSILSAFLPGPSKAPAAPPNFVVVLIDDLRWDELACTGHPFVRTPSIDRIANQGTRFRNAFCTTPLCSPSRANLLTGLETHNHGILDNINRSEQSHKLITFPRILQEQAGYHAGYVGKWRIVPIRSPGDIMSGAISKENLPCREQLKISLR